MDPINSFINSRLLLRKESDSLRTLSTDKFLVDFCSNDYLGFASSPQLKSLIEQELRSCSSISYGSTGSRLISGNNRFTEELEAEIANFHNSPAGLIFNSGYDANLGLFSSLPQRGDTIITDELIHASIIDGARQSHANRFTFSHNNIESLEEKLRHAKGNIFIAVESVYSMDGDEAPLKQMAELAEKYRAALIVDEAHATGILGPGGRGLVNEYGLEDRVFARIVTFGKALGTHGAVVLGAPSLRAYLINFARSFIYSTAAPFSTHLSVKMAYKLLQTTDQQSLIRNKIALFRDASQFVSGNMADSRSTIHSLIIGGNSATRQASAKLRTEGFDVRPILYPTVPEGKERLRICLHTFNSDQEVLNLAHSLLKLV